MVSGQVITTGMGEVIDLDLAAVEIAMKRLRVENCDECFLKVVDIARHMIEKNKESG
jgi:hypothetical protein